MWKICLILQLSCNIWTNSLHQKQILEINNYETKINCHMRSSIINRVLQKIKNVVKKALVCDFSPQMSVILQLIEKK